MSENKTEDESETNQSASAEEPEPNAKAMRASAIGIDLGYSETGATSAIAYFDVWRSSVGAIVDVVAPTEVLSISDLFASIGKEVAFTGARIVSVDAPLTPTRIPQRPEVGRLVDRRFARGEFSNGRRGLQPGSIRNPRPGWPLYTAGMNLLPELNRRGFTYFTFPSGQLSTAVLPERAVVEVTPKLTHGLLCRRALVVARPSIGGFQQIDDWLFPHVFATLAPPASRADDRTYPRHGVHRELAMAVAGVSLGANALVEANRITGLATAARHEALGAFAAGFQAALALVGSAAIAGVEGQQEGYFLLPAKWADDWETVWTRTGGSGDPVRRLPVTMAGGTFGTQ